MKTVRLLIFRALLLITFLTAYLYLLYGQEPAHGVPIVRNAAWNDLVSQMNPITDDPPHESLGKEIFLSISASIDDWVPKTVGEGALNNGLKH